jgi:hypothetical protein
VSELLLGLSEDLLELAGLFGFDCEGHLLALHVCDLDAFLAEELLHTGFLEFGGFELGGDLGFDHGCVS